MPRDFTLADYRILLENIQNAGYSIFPVREFLAKKRNPPWLVLRHDVDRKEKRAVTMARLEKELGVSSTYYFRVGRRFARGEIVQNVEAFGHEVGYHYEVLSKERGNQEKALGTFREELAVLRRIAQVSTAAMHGSPLSRWNDLGLWDACRPEDFGLIGEAYLSFRSLAETVYLTDTGRNWNSEDNLRDRFLPGGPMMPGSLSSTNELIHIIQKNRYPQIYLLVHPNRWTSGVGTWCLQWAEDVCANWLKRGIKRLSRPTREKK